MYKHALRREFDLAVVNCAVRIKLGEDSYNVVETALAFGGAAGARTIVLAETGRQLLGRY